MTMSDLGGSSDVSQDEDFLEKSGPAESESSSDEGAAVGAKRKAPANVKQHSAKKSAVPIPSVSTFRYPLNSLSSTMMVVLLHQKKKKPKSRRKQLTYKERARGPNL